MYEAIVLQLKILPHFQSLSPPVAFAYGCSYIARFEEQQVGIQWSNIAVSPIAEDGYSLLGCILMLMADGAIYMIIAWYIEAVFPGKCGLDNKGR